MSFFIFINIFAFLLILFDLFFCVLVFCVCDVLRFWLQDNASSNDRLFAAGDSIDPSTWGRHAFLCLNHQVQLALLSLFAGVYTLKFFGTLHSLATFCRMGVHMLVMAMSVLMFLQQPGRVVISRGHPTDADLEFVDQLIDYMLVHSGKKPESRARLDYEARLRRLFKDWNAGFHLRGASCHKCSGRDCCPDDDGAALRRRLAYSLQETMLSGAPTTPQTGRWTQLGLCCDWVTFSLTCSFLVIC